MQLTPARSVALQQRPALRAQPRLSVLPVATHIGRPARSVALTVHASKNENSDSKVSKKDRRYSKVLDELQGMGMTQQKAKV